MPTSRETLVNLRNSLGQAGIESASLDARLLLAAALGTSKTDLIAYPERSLSREQLSTVSDYMNRRIAREPVAKILGECEFWGLPFHLSAETLVPRPDTETIVETSLDLVPDRHAPLRLVDLGTGSGCLLISLLHELRRAIGIGIDRSLDAVRTARSNAGRNDVGSRSLFVVSDWDGALQRGIDLIVSNPPYIASDVVDRLEPEVREHDPRLALDGGTDGLDAYRIILRQAAHLLTPEGHLVLEIGYDQEPALRRLATENGFAIVRFAVDLAGNPRCIALKPT